MNHFIYVISLATCKRNLYVFIDSEVNFACSFYNNYKFSVAQKMLYRREILEYPRIVLPWPQAAWATIFLIVTGLQINLYLEQPMEIQLFATFFQPRK
jgi:hypothetical protein